MFEYNWLDQVSENHFKVKANFIWKYTFRLLRSRSEKQTNFYLIEQVKNMW